MAIAIDLEWPPRDHLARDGVIGRAGPRLIDLEAPASVKLE